jgi:glutamyl-tRNA reductase
VNFLENVYLYNIDDLQSIADDYLKQRKEEIARCEGIIAEKVKPLLEKKPSAESSDDRRMSLPPLRKTA